MAPHTSALALWVLLYGVAACAEDSATNTASEVSNAAPRRLDLRAPDIREVLTAQQIAQVLARTRDQNIEEVEVEGARGTAPFFTPDVWPAIAAPFWALLHPTQSWRIFLPIPPDRARRIGAEAPDATSTQREPATGIPPMAGD